MLCFFALQTRCTSLLKFINPVSSKAKVIITLFIRHDLPINGTIPSRAVADNHDVLVVPTLEFPLLCRRSYSFISDGAVEAKRSV